MIEDTIRILLVDDHALLRRGAASMLDSAVGLEVVAQAGTVAGALEALGRSEVDLAVIDLTLPDGDGLELIKQISGRWPDVKVVVLSMHAERAYAERALRAGARGYMMKSEDPGSLVRAVETVAGGGIFLSDAMQQRFLRRVMRGGRKAEADELSRLTDRELAVFRMIGEGQDLRAIAERLRISVKTAQNYRDRLKDKLEIDNSRELLREATLYVERSRHE